MILFRWRRRLEQLPAIKQCRSYFMPLVDAKNASLMTPAFTPAADTPRQFRHALRHDDFLRYHYAG